MLESDSNYQNGQLGELNGLATSFICSIYDGTVAESENTDQLFLLDQMPSSSQAKFSTDIGRIHSVPPMKVQIDLSKICPELINIL